MELLPRRCPVCRDDTIIGHGRRLRQGHDDRHACLWVRRGICQPCKKTFTILPDWLTPSGHYSLLCRQQSGTLRRRIHEQHEAVRVGERAGFSKTELTTEKMAVLVPIPSARAVTAAVVKPGLCLNRRSEYLRS